MASRSPAAIAATRTSSATVPSTPPLRAKSGTGHPVVCILGLPRAAASHRGWPFINDLRFHGIYVAWQKWFRGLSELFRQRAHDETICREQRFAAHKLA